MTNKRYYLFLQGFTCHFLTALAETLRQQGSRVGKVNFNCGDSIYWGKQKAWHFRDQVEQLTPWLKQLITTEQFTDIVLMGDSRPVHLPAKQLAQQFNLRLHVFEEGYLRPNWVTLERDGVNGNSLLPGNPDWYRAAGQVVPHYGDGQSVGNPVALLAAHELAYHIPNCLNPLFYRGYKTHRPAISAIEIAGWAKRFSQMPLWEKQDAVKIKQQLLAGKAPFYLLPLQLDCDSQIQQHSRIKSMTQLISICCQSFARHAPSHSLLVIKNHPLDMGFVNYHKHIKQLEKQLSLQGRIIYLESGHLPTLLDASRGLITINSTAGTSSLMHHCPTLALGSAIYDMPGLTFQGSLDDFWTEGQKPAAKLFRSFRNTVIHTTQVNGSFYSMAGVRLAAAGSGRLLIQEQSRLEQLICQIGSPATVKKTETDKAITNAEETLAEPT